MLYFVACLTHNVNGSQLELGLLVTDFGQVGFGHGSVSVRVPSQNYWLTYFT